MGTVWAGWRQYDPIRLALRQITVCDPLSLEASLLATAASASAWNCTQS